MKNYHEPNRKLIFHHVFKLEKEVFQKNILMCKCGSKQKLEKFCKDCGFAICNICNFLNHRNHIVVGLDKIYTEINKDNWLENKKWLHEFNDNFLTFQEDFIKKIETDKENYQNNAEIQIQEITGLLNDLKNKQITNIENEEVSMHTMFSLVKKSIFTIAEDIDKTNVFYPNKVFQMNRFFNGKIEKKSYMINLEFKINENPFLSKIKEYLS